MNVQIRATGHYLPRRGLTGAEVEAELGLEPGSFADRNGVAHRHRADQSAGETTSQMGTWAAEDALQRANMDPSDLDLIVFASAGPEQVVPDTAPFIQQKLGLGNSGITCFSVHSTCLSFLTAIDVVGSLIETGRYRKALIVSSEVSSVAMNPNDPKTYTLFGDGAAAAILTQTPPGESSRILRAHFSTFGEAAGFTQIPGCGTLRHPNIPSTTFADNTFQMDGREVLLYAMRHAPTVLDKIWPGLTQHCDDFEWIVPHQPSLVGMKALTKYFPPEKTIETLSRYGNCVSASLPLSLDHAMRDARVKRGDRCLLFGTGAGLTIAGISLVL